MFISGRTFETVPVPTRLNFFLHSSTSMFYRCVLLGSLIGIPPLEIPSIWCTSCSLIFSFPSGSSKLHMSASKFSTTHLPNCWSISLICKSNSFPNPFSLSAFLWCSESLSIDKTNRFRELVFKTLTAFCIIVCFLSYVTRNFTWKHLIKVIVTVRIFSYFTSTNTTYARRCFW